MTSFRKKKQHYVPASYIALFSSYPDPDSRRESVVSVLKRTGEHHNQKAENIGYTNDLYEPFSSSVNEIENKLAEFEGKALKVFSEIKEQLTYSSSIYLTRNYRATIYLFYIISMFRHRHFVKDETWIEDTLSKITGRTFSSKEEVRLGYRIALNVLLDETFLDIAANSADIEIKTSEAPLGFSLDMPTQTLDKAGKVGTFAISNHLLFILKINNNVTRPKNKKIFAVPLKQSALFSQKLFFQSWNVEESQFWICSDADLLFFKQSLFQNRETQQAILNSDFSKILKFAKN